MKKILTLLIATGAVLAVQAQSRDEARRVILGDGSGNGKTYPSNGGRDVILGGGNGGGNNYPTYPANNDRQYQVDQVNREYDGKVQSIRNNAYLSGEEKQRAIQQLERDRQRRLRQINAQYNNGGYNNGNDNCNNGNNGQHNGWSKKAKNKNWKKGKRDRD